MEWEINVLIILFSLKLIWFTTLIYNHMVFFLFFCFCFCFCFFCLFLFFLFLFFVLFLFLFLFVCFCRFLTAESLMSNWIFAGFTEPWYSTYFDFWIKRMTNLLCPNGKKAIQEALNQNITGRDVSMPLCVLICL